MADRDPSASAGRAVHPLDGSLWCQSRVEADGTWPAEVTFGRTDTQPLSIAPCYTEGSLPALVTFHYERRSPVARVSRLLLRVVPVILAAGVTAGATGSGATSATRPAPNVLFTPLLTRLRTLYIPAVLPATIPFTATTSSKLYATLDDHTAFSYLINIGYTSGCHGTGACRWGEVVGGFGPDMPTVFDYPKGRHVRLHNGSLALFYPFRCGASCGDSELVFQRAGFVYMVTRKAGSLPDLLIMANSVVTVS